jgi:4-amino-4-deoxy-L-arabinose transferase-like glycosyltransferase
MTGQICLPIASLKAKIGLGIVAFAILSGLVLSKPARNLQDFDQVFYAMLAYDLDKYGVFSNGPFSGVDSTVTPPPPGMFFGPVYPVLVTAAIKLDPRFAEAVRCSVDAAHGHGNVAACESYVLPMRLFNTLLLAISVVALASTAALIFRQRSIFVLSGAIAIVALSFESDIFSYVMTESTIFSIYSLFMLATVLAWRTDRTWHYVLSGLLLGLLCLTKPSFLILFPVIVGLSLLYICWLAGAGRPRAGFQVLAFSLAFCCVVGAWVARNVVSVGKFGFTEEYGAAVLIERFAYNDMTAREFVQAFPYCTPGIGELAFDLVYGTDSMHRFVYHTKGSFFHVGRNRRDMLIAQYGRLDPLIAGIIRDELRTNWWRHLLVSIPLAWCGMWAGWIASLFLIPLFAWACIRAVRSRQPMLPLYSLPAIVMLGLDALIGNHYTRYNLILIGPYALGAAWIISSWLPGAHSRWRLLAPRPLSTPSAIAASDEDST